jgi:hypothetical protein
MIVGVTAVVVRILPMWSTSVRLDVASPVSLLPSERRDHNLLAVDDDQLLRIIDKFRLTRPASQAELIHFWRLWHTARQVSQQGEVAEAVDSRQISLEDVPHIFFDESRFKEMFPPSTGWFQQGPIGLAVKLRDGPGAPFGEGHYGEFVCTLAECAVSPDEPINALNSRFILTDVLAQAAYDCVPPLSPDFLSVALACYSHGNEGFANRVGQYITFDDLITWLVAKPPGEGVCGGTHVCYAVAVMLHVNSVSEILSAGSVARALRYLSEVAKKLKTSQHPDGAWRADWSGGVARQPPAMAPPQWGDALATTGHHLEWLALVPIDGVPDSQIRSALAFTVSTLRVVSDEDVRSSYVGWSHAARALLVWRYVQAAGAQKPTGWRGKKEKKR